MGTILNVPFDGIEFNAYTTEVDGRLNDIETSVGNSNTVVGEIISGWIEPVFNDTYAGLGIVDTVDIVVRANTKVLTSLGEIISISEQTFVFDKATYGGTIDTYMYCDNAGKLYFTTAVSPNMPIGDYIILATPYNSYSGSLGSQFAFKSVIKSNNLLSNYNGLHIENPRAKNTINFGDFGGTTDGTTDVSEQLSRISIVSDSIAKETWKPFVFLPNGVYIIDGSVVNAMQYLKVRGESRDGTIFRSNLTGTIRQQKVESIENLTIDDIWTDSAFDFYSDNVTYNTTATGTITLCLCRGENTTITNTIYNFTDIIYMAVSVINYKKFKAQYNIFNPSGTGRAWHNIRVESPMIKNAIVSIKNNEVHGGVTGIFLGGGRDMPTVGAVIEGNYLEGQLEESIGLDGFGNNADLCPTICNGTITSVDNTGLDGRLKITADMIYTTDGVTGITSTVSLRDDWTNFYYTFAEGTGKDGSVIPIHSFDSAANSITLDSLTLASGVTVGGNVGVQSGFFDCLIKKNIIDGVSGRVPYSTNYYGKAISLYLNVFNTTVDDNTITGCASGIVVIGGIMLGIYKMLAWNNTIKDNTTIDCGIFDSTAGVLTFRTNGTVLFNQYGNQLINHTNSGGKVMEIQHQQNFRYNNNDMGGTPIDWKYCANTLPTANSSQVGKEFMLFTEDADGIPTDITYHRCRLIANGYSWYEV